MCFFAAAFEEPSQCTLSRFRCVIEHSQGDEAQRSSPGTLSITLEGWPSAVLLLVQQEESDGRTGDIGSLLGEGQSRQASGFHTYLRLFEKTPATASQRPARQFFDDGLRRGHVLLYRADRDFGQAVIPGCGLLEKPSWVIDSVCEFDWMSSLFEFLECGPL